jgi:lipopolysaccharide exporter
MSIETRSLNQHAGTALKWNYLGVAVRSLSSLLIGVVLARLLGPKPFGMVAVAALLIGLGNLLADFGFGAAIVQRDTLSEEDIRFVFYFQMLLGVFLALACFLGAGLIAALFRNQEVKPVIRALSLTFPLQAFGQTASSLLKRQLAFRALQFAQIGSYIAYLVIAIPLAVFGFGVWALVIAQLVQVSLSSGIVYSRAPHSLLVSFSINRSILVFGVKVMGSSFANWSISSLDNAFVGRGFGVVALGLYSRAFQLASAPSIAAVSGLQGVLLATYSRVQNREEALRQAYLASLAVMAIAIFPLFATAAVASSTIILALYGRAWIGSAPLFVPLALAMPLYALLALSGPLLWAAGKVGLEFRVQVTTAVIAVAVFSMTCRVSVVCLAWGVLAVYAFRLFGMTREIVHHLKITWINVGNALRGGAAVAMVTSAAVWISDSFMMRVALPPMVRLVVDFAAALSAIAVPLAMAPKVVLGPHADLVLLQLRLMIPDSARAFMPRTPLA